MNLIESVTEVELGGMDVFVGSMGSQFEPEWYIHKVLIQMIENNNNQQPTTTTTI